MEEQKIKYSKLYINDNKVIFEIFGCNFRCCGIGMPAGKKSNEYRKIDPENYKSIYDLPDVKTGCSTYYSWDTRFKDLVANKSISEIAEFMAHSHATEIVVGGGEPLLIQNKLVNLFTQLENYPDTLWTIKIQTNATKILTIKFIDYISVSNYKFVFMCSPKLPSTDTRIANALNYSAFNSYYINTLNGCTDVVLNFTVTHPNVDEKCIKLFISEYEGYCEYNKAHDIYPEGASTYIPVSLTPHKYATKEDHKKVIDLCNNNHWDYKPLKPHTKKEVPLKELRLEI